MMVNLTRGQLVSHYVGVGALVFISIFVFWLGKWPLGILLALGAVGVYFFQRQRLSFREIAAIVSASVFEAILKQYVEEQKLDVESLEGDTFVAFSRFSWRSWGERITIVREKDRILFNSICDPDKHTSFTSFGRNRRNFVTFLAALEKNAGQR